MNINDILNEDLGTLTQLGVGPLINLLKQPVRYGSYGRHGRDHPDIYEIGKRFQHSNIGSTSEIRDVGQIKQGIKSIRKVFKENEDAEGFALYIGGYPVMFTITDAYNLAGSSRSNLVAYDLRKYSEVVNKLTAEKYIKPAHTTIRLKDPEYFDRIKLPKPFAGSVYSTSDLSDLIDLIQKVAADINQSLTAKLVMKDVVAAQKKLKRYTNNEVATGAKDLKTRLAIYKNSKRPSVNTIEEFVKISLNNPGKTVQFAGYTYLLSTKALDKTDPVKMLSGEPFKVYYNVVDPGSYNSLDIVYRYEKEDNQLIPIKATWYDRAGDSRESQSAILDVKGYLKSYLKIKSLDQNTVINALMNDFKQHNLKHMLLMVNALKKAGYAWPELGVLEKSAQTQLSKQK